jgi:S-adenosylmethionine synthetase
MSVLITGASGLLGREILNQFTLKFTNDAVIGLGYTRSEGLVKCNLLDSDATKQLIMDIKPKLIIHSAAERRPDVAAKNPLQTNMLNVEVTRNLAMLASQLDAVFIYISTDYVFDGTSPPYQVTDTPNPVNEYGKSKYQGEIAAMQVNPLTIVLRVPFCMDGQETDLNLP